MDTSTGQDRIVRYLNVERYRRLLKYASLHICYLYAVCD